MNRVDANGDKDKLIANLKKQIFDLEQNEKNYNSLSSKFKNLQTEYSAAAESKLKLEYEFKQKIEILQKEVYESREENDTLHQTLEERIYLNKKLYQDNTALHKLVEARENELEEMNNELQMIRTEFEKNLNEKESSAKNLKQLDSDLMALKEDMKKMTEDNVTLMKVVDDQESLIKGYEAEKKKLLNKIDELNFELKNSSNKLNGKEAALNESLKQLDELNQNYSNLEDQCVEVHNLNERLKLEINNMKKDINKEKTVRQECDRTIERLEGLLREKDKEIRQNLIDIENLKVIKVKQGDDKSKMQGEIDRLKSHIMTLTEVNQRYIDEIENIVENDERIRHQFSLRKEQNDSLIFSNKQTLESSLNNLEEFLNKPNKQQISSPSKYPNSRQISKSK